MTIYNGLKIARSSWFLTSILYSKVNEYIIYVHKAHLPTILNEIREKPRSNEGDLKELEPPLPVDHNEVMQLIWTKMLELGLSVDDISKVHGKHINDLQEGIVAYRSYLYNRK